MALLEVRDLTKTFIKQREKITAVDHVSFSIEPGECLGLIGESGCGKSTTAELVARLEREDSGSIVLEGEELTARRGLRPPKDISVIFQNAQDSFDPRERVLQAVEQGAEGLHLPKSARRDKAREMMRFVDLPEQYETAYFHELSGGQCQRAAIARALISTPKLLICDEATSALDVVVQAGIMDLLKRLKESGMSMLFITHDLPLASQICDRIAVMDHGTIVEYGKTEEVLHSPQAEETRRLLDAVLKV